jgi:nitrate/TMAO reductase-like tetraheme cytochrome c subunit
MTNPERDSVGVRSKASIFANWTSLAGMILAASAFFAVVCLIALDFIRGFNNPYMGILTYMVAPGFLVAGLLLIGVGAFREFRRQHRLAPGEVPLHPRIDLNNPRHRKQFVIISVVTVVFLLFTALGSYQTYHYTESVQFCGQVCHSVMEPEFTAYQNSPHANVACVQCHIGPGADWFVKSKLSGSYQVYSVIAKKYPTPIPTPIHNLRPARETCEQCHWPAKFYGEAVRDNRHYLANESNSVWNIKLLMKIGGGDAQHGEVGGIHWHTSPNHKIEYIATDEKRLAIPWVRVTHADGKVEVFESESDPLNPEQVDAGEKRLMDCIDCHNRPAHSYQAPAHAVNRALRAGRLDSSIHDIKRLAVEALTANYQTREEAAAGIAAKVPAAAVAEVQRIYSENFFPEMKVNWRAYPNHIGHTIFPGCYRCHDGQHKSAAGNVITHDCNACHSIISQGEGTDADKISPKGLEFVHPVDIADMWKEMNCAECHSGALAQ